MTLPHKGCFSLHSCQTAMLPHVGKLNSAYSAFSNCHSTFIRAIGSLSYQVLSLENSHWAGLGRILGRCLCNHTKTLSSVYVCLFSREGFPTQTYIKQVRWKHGCKLGSNLDCRLYNNSFAPGSALGGACARGRNTMALIAQLSNCNVATCWQVELSILSLLQLSFNIHSSTGFICPIKFFHLKTAIGLALGES